MDHDIKLLQEWAGRRLLHFIDTFLKEDNPALLESELEALVKVAELTIGKLHKITCLK
jgi:hypothetical protein